MSLDDLQAALRTRGGKLVLAGDRLRVEAPTGTIPTELLEAVRADKDALVSELHEQQRACFRLVDGAVETVAQGYLSGCIDGLRGDQRAAIAKAECELDAAALAGDVPATTACADVLIGAWRQALADRALVIEVVGLTVDEWCSRPDRPTIVLATPHGEVLLVTDREAYARAVDEGQAAFSPLEVEQLIAGHNNGLVNEQLVHAVVETKRAFPGARLEDVCKPGAARSEPRDPPAGPRRETRTKAAAGGHGGQRRFAALAARAWRERSTAGHRRRRGTLSNTNEGASDGKDVTTQGPRLGARGRHTFS